MGGVGWEEEVVREKRDQADTQLLQAILLLPEALPLNPLPQSWLKEVYSSRKSFTGGFDGITKVGHGM